MEKIGAQLSHTVLKQVNGGTQENLFFKVESRAFEGQLSLARS
jgi:adenylate cyclase class IV